MEKLKLHHLGLYSNSKQISWWWEGFLIPICYYLMKKASLLAEQTTSTTIEKVSLGKSLQPNLNERKLCG